MLRVTKLTDYAIVVLTQLARASEDGPHTARDIAECTEVPQPTVAKLLKRLAREGLVVGLRGATGGYRLARPADSVTVADVVQAIEGPIAVTECSHDDSGLCDVEAACSVRTYWQRINLAVQSALSGITLADMCRPEPTPLVQLQPRSARSVQAD